MSEAPIFDVQQQIRLNCTEIAEKYSWNFQEPVNDLKENYQVYKVSFSSPQALQIVLIFLPGYPLTTPLFHVKENNHKVSFPPLDWNFKEPPYNRLSLALDQFVKKSDNSEKIYAIRYGPTKDDALMNVCRESWKPFICELNRGETYDPKLFTRVEPVVSHALMDQNILIFGCSSVGSLIAEMLVRSGFRNLTLVDVDIVRSYDVSCASYNADDIGKKKLHALHLKLKRINPYTHVNEIDKNLTDVEHQSFFKNQITKHDIVIGATDDSLVQERINEIAYHSNKPAVYAGVYDKGKGGEIVFSIPQFKQPCYHCLTYNVKRPISTSYNLKNLDAVVALGSDIACISNIATKIVTAILLYINQKIEPTKEHDSYRLWVFGRDILNYYCYHKLSFYEDFRNEMQEDIGGFSMYFYANQLVWYTPEHTVDKKKRHNCSICSEDIEKRMSLDEVQKCEKAPSITTLSQDDVTIY